MMKKPNIIGQFLYQLNELVVVQLIVKLLKNRLIVMGERRVELVFLSYVNLWATRNLAKQVVPQWQKYDLKKMPDKITPSIVQRDYKRIIRTFGTSSPSPKVRGYSSGREKGTKLFFKISDKLLPIPKKFVILYKWHKLARIAQSVEQRTENPRVGGSIPPPGMIYVRNVRGG